MNAFMNVVNAPTFTKSAFVNERELNIVNVNVNVNTGQWVR